MTRYHTAEPYRGQYDTLRALSSLLFSTPSCLFALASASQQRLGRVPHVLPLRGVMPIEPGGPVLVTSIP
jgi:hypothetical protein